MHIKFLKALQSEKRIQRFKILRNKKKGHIFEVFVSIIANLQVKFCEFINVLVLNVFYKFEIN